MLDNKTMLFLKFTMAQWPFFKLKNRNIFAMDGPISTKFGMVMLLDPSDVSANQIL